MFKVVVWGPCLTAQGLIYPEARGLWHFCLKTQWLGFGKFRWNKIKRFQMTFWVKVTLTLNLISSLVVTSFPLNITLHYIICSLWHCRYTEPLVCICVIKIAVWRTWAKNGLVEMTDMLEVHPCLCYSSNKIRIHTLMKMTFDFFDVSAMRLSLYFSHKGKIDQKAKNKGGIVRAHETQ